MNGLRGRMRAEWLRMARDPVYFAELMLPRKPHNQCPVVLGHDCPQVGTVHEHGQVKWLHEANAYVNVLVPGNRWGKSTVEAMRHLYHCMFKIGAQPTGKHTWATMPYDTISAAYSADQSMIVHNELLRLAKHPTIAPFISRVRTTPFPSVRFYNGSVFHARSAHDGGKYLDGHAYRYVSIDEAGWIDNLKSLMNQVILMRLAGGGMVDLIGTPKGFGDLYWYANRGLRGVDGYYVQRGSIFDNPFLPPEDIKRRDELLQHSDPRLRDQVIYGAFVSSEGMAFTQDQLDNAFDADLPAHQDYVEGRRYAQAWDLGRRTDYTVGITLDVTEKPYPLVDFTRLNRVPWETIYETIKAKRNEYHVHSPAIDASGPMGDVVEEELTKRGIFVDPVKISSGERKTNLVNTLQSALDYGREQIGERDSFDEAGILHKVPDLEPPGGKWGLLRLPAIPVLLDEMGRYQLDDKNLQQDCVMALALATQVVYDGEFVFEPIEGSIYR